jgi:hypothetical protein
MLLTCAILENDEGVDVMATWRPWLLLLRCGEGLLR